MPAYPRRVLDIGNMADKMTPQASVELSLLVKLSSCHATEMAQTKLLGIYSQFSVALLSLFLQQQKRLNNGCNISNLIAHTSLEIILPFKAL